MAAPVPAFTESEELRQVRAYLGRFNEFTHYWFPRGRTQAEPMCDPGLIYRDAKHVPLLKVRDGDPTCPACRRQLGKGPRALEGRGGAEHPVDELEDDDQNTAG